MKDQTILAIKGLAIIGVVLHHLVNRRMDVQVDHWMWLLQILFDWCVLGFIAVSGYLHALSDSRRPKGVAEFSLLRFNRLLVPWLLLILVFSLVWQGLQALHIPNIAVTIPRDFLGKIAASLWPVRGPAGEQYSVGEQLYYLPILFGASVLFVLFRGILGMPGIVALTGITFVAGLHFFPKSFTGFSLGVFLWALCFYAAGYLLFHHRAKVGHIRLTLIFGTVLLFLFSGYEGIIRSVPLWLIVDGTSLKLSHIPGLARLGEASGTIYIYHTPFILQPLVIAAAYLPGAVPQFIGVLGAGAVAMTICTIFYQLLKNRPAKILLM